MKQPDPEILPLPCCPHCGKELDAMAFYNWPAPGGAVLACYCPHEECRKILQMQVVLVAAIPGEADDSRIMRPS